MKLFYDILTYQNYDVEKAYDGLEAYQKIESNKYDLIILDIQLPKMDGFKVLKKLKEKNISLSNIIIVSACAMDEDKAKAKAFNIETYLTKPIDINNFLKTVKEKLD